MEPVWLESLQKYSCPYCGGAEADSDVDVRLVVLKDHIRSGQSIYLHHQGILYRNLPAVREFNLFDEDHQFWQQIWDHVRCSSEMLLSPLEGRGGYEYADC